LGRRCVTCGEGFIGVAEVDGVIPLAWIGLFPGAS
jgi:hypothetical protein